MKITRQRGKENLITSSPFWKSVCILSKTNLHITLTTSQIKMYVQEEEKKYWNQWEQSCSTNITIITAGEA